MPQMAPIWWTTLFMMFIISYMMFMTILYFFMIYNKTYKTPLTPLCKNHNWKW